MEDGHQAVNIGRGHSLPGSGGPGRAGGAKLIVLLIGFFAGAALFLAFDDDRPPPAGERDASIYIGPEPGVKLILVDEVGVRHEIGTVAEENGALHIKEKTYFSEKLSLEGKASTTEAEYMLYAEGPQLIVKTMKGKKTVFLDLDEDSWNAPANIFRKIFDKWICRKTASGQEEILGKERKTVEVVCEADGSRDKRVWAEGLGCVRYAIGGEKEVIDVRLTGMERTGGE